MFSDRKQTKLATVWPLQMYESLQASQCANKQKKRKTFLYLSKERGEGKVREGECNAWSGFEGQKRNACIKERCMGACVAGPPMQQYACQFAKKLHWYVCFWKIIANYPIQKGKEYTYC